MIVKKITSRRSRKSKAGHIRDLTGYIAGVGDERAKVYHQGGSGFICEDLMSQQAEMIALATEAVRSPNPISHWVLSWQEGEQPTPAQLDDAVALFLREMELEGHQVIFAAHKDTENLHLHLAINRVHPTSLRVVKPHRGFDIEAAHRAVAQIEHLQGWEREARGRYEVAEDGALVRAGRAQPDTPKPTARARDFEARTAQASAQRIGMEHAGDILRSAGSWTELHAALSQVGMRYERKGSGAILWVGEVATKASTIGREFSLSAMVKRLGPFDPLQELDSETPRPSRELAAPAWPDAVGWQHYRQTRQAHFDSRRNSKRTLLDKQREEFAQLTQSFRDQRRLVLAGSWNGMGIELNALRSSLALEQAKQRAALRDRHAEELRVWRRRSGAFPCYEDWLHDRGCNDEAKVWRYRSRFFVDVVGAGEVVGSVAVRDIRHFTAMPRGKAVYYVPSDEPSGQAAFIDRGTKVEIHQMDDRALLAGMQLAAAKFDGRIRLDGPPETLARMARLAASEGIIVVNPELQVAVNQESPSSCRKARERHGAKPDLATRHQQFDAFKQLLHGLRADGYELIAEQRLPSGALIRETVTELPATAEQHRDYLLRSVPGQPRIKPRFRDKRLLFLEYDSPDVPQALVHVPAAVLQIEGRSIVMLAVANPVSDAALDRVGRTVARGTGGRLLSSIPLGARLLSASGSACPELGARIAAAAQDLQYRERPLTESAVLQRSPNAAYFAHARCIMEQNSVLGRAMAPSRIDALVATRMRLTGHDRDVIERALQECRPLLSDASETHDWKAYAKRAADYAFGPAGTRSHNLRAVHRRSFYAVEGREQDYEARRRGASGLLASGETRAQSADAMNHQPNEPTQSAGHLEPR